MTITGLVEDVASDRRSSYVLAALDDEILLRYVTKDRIVPICGIASAVPDHMAVSETHAAVAVGGGFRLYKCYPFALVSETPLVGVTAIAGMPDGGFAVADNSRLYIFGTDGAIRAQRQLEEKATMLAVLEDGVVLAVGKHGFIALKERRGRLSRITEFAFVVPNTVVKTYGNNVYTYQPDSRGVLLWRWTGCAFAETHNCIAPHLVPRFACLGNDKLLFFQTGEALPSPPPAVDSYSRFVNTFMVDRYSSGKLTVVNH